MEEKYTPQVGDKVRATMGENVVVGEVEYTSKGATEVRVGVELFALDTRSWQFEQIVSVPSKFGAVIRRADGYRWVRIGRDTKLQWHRESGDVYGDDAQATAGGFTVLFDGLDE